MSNVTKAIEEINNQILAPNVVKTEGAGKAYQAVAQSMAIAIQDVTDHLRNISTLTSTAVAVATERMVAEPEKADLYSKIIAKAQANMNRTADSFEKIGVHAGNVLKDFPSGSD